MNQDEINEREWANPDNWYRNGDRIEQYRSTKDTRLWVPKRSGYGSTMNEAHSNAPLFTVLCIVGILAMAIMVIVIKHLINDFGWLQSTSG